MSNREFIRYKTVAGTRGSLDLLNHAAAEALQFNAHGDKDIFPALVITKPAKLTPKEALAMGVPGKTRAGHVTRGSNWKFKVAFVDSNPLSQFLTDPGNPMVSSKNNPDSKLDAKTICSTHIDVVMISANASAPSAGSLVFVRLKRGGACNGYDLSQAEWVSTQAPATNTGGGSNFTNISTPSMKQTFDTLPTATAEPAGSARDDPTGEKCNANPKQGSTQYPNLPYKSKTTTAISTTKLFQLLRSSGLSETAQKMIFAITRQEQGNSYWPANNPSGMMSNQNWRAFFPETEIDYQICVIPNAKAASGTHRKGKWFQYLGFDTPERGIAAMGKVIEARVGKSFKNLTGDIDAQARTMATNYNSDWRFKLSKSEIARFEAGEEVERDGSVLTKKGAISAYAATQKGILLQWQQLEAQNATS